MRVPDSWVRATPAFLLVGFFAAVAACSSSSDPGVGMPDATPTDVVVVVQTETPEPTKTAVPTATPTPFSAVDPYPTSTPFPPTPEPAEVVFVDVETFGEPVVGSVFEALLAHLPDNEITRSYTKLSDYGGMLDLLGLERFPLGATDEQIKEHALTIFNTSAGGLRIGLPEWPGYLRMSSEKPNWYPFVGFEFVNVDQAAYSTSRFEPRNGEPRPPQDYNVAFGPFDSAITANSLATCDCTQPLVRVHEGLEYYAWGEELAGDLRRRWAPPVYDDTGRGPRLFVVEGVAYWTLLNSAMDDLINVELGHAASLAESEAYVSVIRKMLVLGQMRDITLRTTHLSVAELSDNGMNDYPEYPDVAQEVPLLEKFTLVAEGVGFDGERAFTGLVIAHEDAETARRNGDLLAARVKEMRRQVRDEELWSDMLERAEIGIDGSDLLVRLYYKSADVHSYSFPVLQHETLVVHE